VVCPSHIPLAEWFQLGQFKQHEKDLEKKLAIEARERFEKRNQRLARIEADQEAKRTTRRDKGAIALTKARQSREKSI
jgi:electron transport complex protein RnfC